jgi:hypothetical protein
MQCAICHDDVEDGTPIPCQHPFHPTCLQPWAKQTNSCPVCRQAIDPTKPVVGLRSDTSDDRSVAVRLAGREFHSVGEMVALMIFSQYSHADLFDTESDVESQGQCSLCWETFDLEDMTTCPHCSVLYCCNTHLRIDIPHHTSRCSGLRECTACAQSFPTDYCVRCDMCQLYFCLHCTTPHDFDCYLNQH